jgi:hypothetical protein
VTLPAPGDPRRIRYRYHFTDFRLGRLLTTLPMTGVKLDDVLSGSSTGSGTVPLSPQVVKRDPFSATVTRRSICWAERQVLTAGGRLASSSVPWAGIVMKRTRQYGGRAMKLDMVTFPGYLARRFVADGTYTQADKFRIFRNLLGYACDQPLVDTADPGVYSDSPHTWILSAPFYGAPANPLVPTNLSGILADRTYLSSDLKPTLSALSELADSGDGFDWRISPIMVTPGDLTSFAWRLDLGYPRLGRIAPPDLRWSTDRADRRQRWGFVEDLTLIEDGSAVNNQVTAVGSGTGADQIRATVSSLGFTRDETRSGYMLFEGQTGGASNDDRTYDTVYGKARGALLAGFASEVQVSGIKVRGDLHPTLDSYELGDDLTIRVGDTITGQPTTIVGQLIGRSIVPPERGGTEQVTLDIQGTVAA